MSAVATAALLAAPPRSAAPSAVTAAAPAAPRLRIVPPPVVPRAYQQRPPLGDPTPLVCTVTRTAMAVALGGGGIDQLVRWITPELRSSLLTQHSLSRRYGYTPRGPLNVVRVRLCRVARGAVEAAVVATEGEVVHAIAMRLEEVAGRWLVTVLDIG